MRLIDADALREQWLESGENERIYNTNDMLDSIDLAPTIDAEVIVHGAIVERIEDRIIFDRKVKNKVDCCSVCGKRLNEWYQVKYCMYCGAKFDGGKNDGK